LDEEGNPAFPNATVYINRKDWEQGTSIESYGKKVLLALEDCMEFIESEYNLCPGINVISAPGHTPGHSIIKINSENQEFLYISDIRNGVWPTNTTPILPQGPGAKYSGMPRIRKSCCKLIICLLPDWDTCKNI
jgi:hypothetical protein